MKLSIFVIAASNVTAQEGSGNGTTAAAPAAAPAEASPEQAERQQRNLASDDDYYYDYNLGGDDSYDDIYYDGLGNKKKKKKNNYNKPKPPSSSFPVPNSVPSGHYGNPTQPSSGPNYGGVYAGSSINAPAGHTQSHAPAPGVSNNWFGAVNTVDTWTPLSWQAGKGQTTTWTTNLSPLIGNGRFCWNCYAIADAYGDAYYNCFNDGKGFLEMCSGEEYFCMWNERRHEGRVTEVGGGCKSAHSCKDQMTENFTWDVSETHNPKITGDQCRSGSNHTVEGQKFQDSMCSWCCDGMVSNRFSTADSDLCNHKDFEANAKQTTNPAKFWAANGNTDNFPWYTRDNLYAGTYTDGEYHRLFMIAIQAALGEGILGTLP